MTKFKRNEVLLYQEYRGGPFWAVVVRREYLPGDWGVVFLRDANDDNAPQHIARDYELRRALWTFVGIVEKP